MAGADTPDWQRLEALGALVADHITRHPARSEEEAPDLPIFHTAAHAALLRELTTRARVLAGEGFKGNNGAPCCTLLGPRGIGKTAVLRAFALVAPSAFPSLLPVYLSGQGIMLQNHVLQAGHLQGVLAAAAALQGLAFEPPFHMAGRRLLILMDEFEDLYRAPPSAPVLVHNVLTTLWGLNILGNSTAGNSSVLLCGSSASTFSLVQGFGGEQLGRAFPLVLAGIPDLNDTKFMRLRLPASLCNASDEVSAILDTVLGVKRSVAGGGKPTAAARLLTFFVGATPRAVIRAVFPHSVAELTGALLAAACPAIPPDSSFGHPATGAFLRALLARLAVRNKELSKIAQFRKLDGGANFSALMDPKCAWEEKVVPLAWEEVEAAFAWATAGEWDARAAPPSHPAVLMSMLDEISDRHLLRVHYPDGLEATAQVWPATAAQAVAGAAGGLLRLADLAGAAAALAQAIRVLGPLAGAV